MKPLALYVAPTDDRRTVSAVPWELLLDPRLQPMTKLVAAVLWGHMNPAGECCPGQEELGRICGVSIRTVRRATAELRRTLWLEVQSRSRGAVKLPSMYRARHPIHGPVKRPRVPEQMALTLIGMQRGAANAKRTPVASAQDTDGHLPEDTHGLLTNAVTTKRVDGLRQEEPTDPEWLPGGPKFREVMASLKAAHVPPPRRVVRRDGER